MSLLNRKIIGVLPDGVHKVRLTGYTEGVTKQTADGKGGDEYISIKVRVKGEQFDRDSFSNPAMCFLKDGVPLSKFTREVTTQLAKEPEDIVELLEMMKHQDITVTAGWNTDVATGRMYPSYTWLIPKENDVVPQGTPEELPEGTQL